MFGLLGNELGRNQKEVADDRVESLLEILDEEVIFADNKEIGFSRTFKLPALINGLNYSLYLNNSPYIISNSSARLPNVSPFLTII